MKGFLANISKQSGKLLLIAGLTPWAVGCGHLNDPTQAAMTTYEMPSAVVVQTPPSPLNPNTPWQPPQAGGGVQTAYATYPGTPPAQTATSPGSADPNGYPAGSTVVRQAPITIERPSIVINQPPIWVGNPPVPIPQPPVVMHQAPITVEQPSFVLQPPKIGFHLPQLPGLANQVEPKVAAPKAPEPKVAQAQPPVEEKAPPTQKSTTKKHAKKKSGKKAVKKGVDSALPPK